MRELFSRITSRILFYKFMEEEKPKIRDSICFSIFRNNETKKTYFSVNFYPNQKELISIIHTLLEIIKKGDEWIGEENNKLRKEWEKDLEKHNKLINKLGQKEEKEGYVYLIKSKNRYKIGRGKTKKRGGTIVTESPFETELLFQIRVNNYIEMEKELHERYSLKRKKGEWFELNKIDIEIIKKYLVHNSVQNPVEERVHN